MNNRPKQWINLNGTQNDWLMCVRARESVSDWKITLKMYCRICLVSSKINVECASNDNNCTYFSRLKMGTKFTHTTFDAECNEKSVNSIRKSWQIHGICLFFCLDFFGRFWSTVCVCPSTFSKCTIETITKCAKYCRERRRSEIESNEQESREKKTGENLMSKFPFDWIRFCMSSVNIRCSRVSTIPSPTMALPTKTTEKQKQQQWQRLMHISFLVVLYLSIRRKLTASSAVTKCRGSIFLFLSRSLVFHSMLADSTNVEFRNFIFVLQKFEWEQCNYILRVPFVDREKKRKPQLKSNERENTIRNNFLFVLSSIVRRSFISFICCRSFIVFCWIFS